MSSLFAAENVHIHNGVFTLNVFNLNTGTLDTAQALGNLQISAQRDQERGDDAPVRERDRSFELARPWEITRPPWSQLPPAGSVDHEQGQANAHNKRPEQPNLCPIASSTLDAIRKGYIDLPALSEGPHGRQPVQLRYNIHNYLKKTQEHTQLYGEDAPELVGWVKPPEALRNNAPGYLGALNIELKPMSTLQGARYIADALSGTTPISRKIGILNFASEAGPGGKFITGGHNQEESIARSSSLYISLSTSSAKPFYDLHRMLEKDASGWGRLYTHTMVYSPSVVAFRDDEGQWLAPLTVDVVSSRAVDAGTVRKALLTLNASSSSGPTRSPQEIESLILSVMHERMARVLALFEAHSIRHLVLGAFGTGGCQNDAEGIASIWMKLLGGPHARFNKSFDHVVFAIPDLWTVEKFRKGMLRTPLG